MDNVNPNRVNVATGYGDDRAKKEGSLQDDSGRIKHSYTIPCASSFRNEVETLAHKRKVNVGDIARSVLLVIPLSVIDGYPDPGEPGIEDRETVILKSGPALGRPWRRKPRIQVRMAEGYSVEQIRKALGIALSIEFGVVRPHLLPPDYVYQATPPTHPPQEITVKLAEKPVVEKPVAEKPPAIDHTAPLREEVERLMAIVNVLAFDPLPNGVFSSNEALHVLGYPPNARPRFQDVRARFRMLATIHHPDSTHGNHQRMSQINQAMTVLRTVSL